MACADSLAKAFAVNSMSGCKGEGKPIRLLDSFDGDKLPKSGSRSQVGSGKTSSNTN